MSWKYGQEFNSAGTRVMEKTRSLIQCEYHKKQKKNGARNMR